MKFKIEKPIDPE